MAQLKETERKDADIQVRLMMAKREKYEQGWRRCRDAFAPSRGRFSDDEEPRRRVTRRNSNPYRIADEYAAGVQSGLVSPTRQWFALTLFNKELFEIQAVREWIGQVEAIMAARMLQTNFYDQVVDFMKEQGVFGTAAMFIEEDDREVFHCKTLTCGQYAIDVDGLGRVNRFCRKLKFSLVELVKEFGEENLPKEIRQDLKEMHDTGARARTYDVWHLLQPNNKYDAQSQSGGANMKYQSLWWLANYSEPSFIRRHGYEEIPVVVGRWRVISDDVYGREHPGELALDDAVTLQELEADGRSALEHSVKPSLIAPRTLAGRVNAKPLGITLYDPVASGTAPVIQPLHDVVFDYQAAENKIELLLRNIEQAFYIDLFRMWSTDLRIGRTATEIQAREDEKAYMLGPITLRQTAEVLDTAINRIYSLMMRAGLFPPPPPEISEGETLRVEYMSEFALLQKRAAQGGIETLLTMAAQVAQLQGATGQYPEVLDNINGDKIIEAIADMHSLPVGIVRGEDQVAEIRGERGQQMAAQQQAIELQQAADNVQPMADAAQTMSETPVTNQQEGSQQSMLDMLLGAAQDGSMGDMMNQMADQINADQGRQFNI